MQCALCKTGNTKEDSHIIPAFVFRWLKESSPTGFLRGTAEPNTRLQDGKKGPLLCEVCEDRFSKLETEFANRVFREVHHGMRGDLAFDYSAWFHRFCVSISWRTLTYLARNGRAADFPYDQGVFVAEALERWRLYLLEQIPDVGKFTQHFLILDSPIEATNMDLSELGLYIKRGVDFNTIHAPDECYIFSKLCDVLIVGTLHDPKPQQWIRTRVSDPSGRYEPGDFQVSGCVTTFFQTALEEIKKGRTVLSPKQADKIADKFRERFPNARIKD